jgi:hypothetical protein
MLSLASLICTNVIFVSTRQLILVRKQIGKQILLANATGQQVSLS